MADYEVIGFGKDSIYLMDMSRFRQSIYESLAVPPQLLEGEPSNSMYSRAYFNAIPVMDSRFYIKPDIVTWHDTPFQWYSRKTRNRVGPFLRQRRRMTGIAIKNWSSS